MTPAEMEEHLALLPSSAARVIEADYFSDEIAPHLSGIDKNTPGSLIIISRRRPSWVTDRDILYGSIIEIDQHALRFTYSECATLARCLPDVGIRDCYLQSRGWPAIAAALASKLPSSLQKTRQSTYLERFVETEILEPLNPQARSTLSLLAHLEPQQCPVVAQSLAFPLEAELRELPCIKRSSGRGLAMHPLVRRALQQWCESHRTAIKSNIDVQSFVSVLLDAGLHAEAFSICSTLGDCEGQQRILELGADDLLRDGRLSTLAEWLRSLEQSGRWSAPLGLRRSQLALRMGDLREARTIAELAAASTDDADIQAAALNVAGTAAHLEHDNDSAYNRHSLASNLARADSHLGDARYGALLALAASPPTEGSASERHPPEVDMSDAKAIVRAAVAAYSARRAEGSLAGIAKACAAAEPLLPLIHDPVVESSFRQAYAYTLALGSQYSSALEQSHLGLELARRCEIHFAIPHLLLTRALAAIGSGAHDSARNMLMEAQAKASTGPARDYVDANRTLLEARIDLARGDFDAALSTLASPHTLSSDRALVAEALATRAVCFALLQDAEEASADISAALAISTGAEVSGCHLAVRVGLESLKPASEAAQCLHMGAAVKVAILDPLNCVLPSLDISSLRASPAWESERLEHSIAHLLGNRAPNAKGRDLLHSLTRRELEIARHLARGRTNAEIARDLHITESTTKLHVRHILKKLRARNRVEATAILLRDGLGSL